MWRIPVNSCLGSSADRHTLTEFFGLLQHSAADWRRVSRLILTQFAAGLLLLAAILSSVGKQEKLALLTAIALGILMLGMVADAESLLGKEKDRSGKFGARPTDSLEWFPLLGCLLCTAGALAWPLTQIRLAVACLGIAGVWQSAITCLRANCVVWPAKAVFPRFFGATLLLGATGGAFWAGWFVPALAPTLASVATVIRTALFAWERIVLRSGLRMPDSPSHRSATVAVTTFGSIVRTRTVLFFASTTFSLMAICNLAHAGPVWGSIACTTTFSSQLLERYLFFVTAPLPSSNLALDKNTIEPDKQALDSKSFAA